MTFDWLGIAGIVGSAILGISSMVGLMKNRRRVLPDSTRVDDQLAPWSLDGLSPWMARLRQLDVPDFEVLSVLKSRREQGVFLVRLVGDPGARVLKMFVHEAGAATMLTAQREIFSTYLLGDGPTCLHPSIARTRDRSATALIRDWIPGETLLDFMVHRGRLLTFTEADILVRRLCSATDELHSVGMIHCDIKPSNIVGQWREAFEGRSATIRLIDFGMFAPVDPQATDRGPVAVEGTPNFTAPERLFFSTASRASDVYSCAVVAIFALTGQHQSGLTYIPRPLRFVLMRASSREAASRYSTISEFAEAWDSAFRSVAASRDVNRLAVSLPSWDSLIEGAGLNTILRSPLGPSGMIGGGSGSSIDQELLRFRERNADMISRLGSLMESKPGSPDSKRFDALLRALESKLAESASSSEGPPATPLQAEIP